PCYHPQQRRLAAPGGPDKDYEFAIADRDVDAMDNGCCTKGLSYVADCDRSHSVLPRLPRQPFVFFFLLLPRAPGAPAQGKSSDFRRPKSKPDVRPQVSKRRPESLIIRLSRHRPDAADR